MTHHKTVRLNNIRHIVWRDKRNRSTYSLFLPVFILSIFATNTFAGIVLLHGFSANIGISYTDLYRMNSDDISPFSGRASMNAGIFGEILRTNISSLIFGIAYSQKGYIEYADYEEYRIETRLHYLSFPFLLRFGYFHWKRMPTLLIGATIDRLFSSSTTRLPDYTEIRGDLEPTTIGATIRIDVPVIFVKSFQTSISSGIVYDLTTSTIHFMTGRGGIRPPDWTTRNIVYELFTLNLGLVLND